MNFTLSDEQVEIKRLAKEFAEKELAPGVKERDENHAHRGSSPAVDASRHNDRTPPGTDRDLAAVGDAQAGGIVRIDLHIG